MSRARALLNFPHLSLKPGLLPFWGRQRHRAYGLSSQDLDHESPPFWWFFATGRSVAHQISFVTHQAQFGGKNRFCGAIIWRDERPGRPGSPSRRGRGCVLPHDPLSLGALVAARTGPCSMRLSRFFLPILRETPKEAEIVSHRLMLRAGMIRQEAASIYAWLPLGFRVLKKVEEIVREEQNRAGAIEVLMPTLQLADLWRESGRYDAYGPEMLRIADRHKRERLDGPTNEEMITEIFRAYIKSYRNLPLNLYHIQWKFRDEQRPRFGVMRGREFLLKDAYSFDVDKEAARRSYNKMFVAYLRTFARMGLKAIPMAAETGPIGGDLSHEFIVLAETGESAVFCDKKVLDLPIPDAGVDYDGDLAPIINQWTSLNAATSDVHDK